MMEEESTYLIDRYRLLEPLGSGGMAVVYKALDEMLERIVAVKILREDYAQDEDFRERFKQEAKSAANLSHPNIVTVYDFGLDEKQVFIVIEYINGTDLKSLIRERGRFSVEDTVGLVAQACAGVGYAHRAGLVHCDIKPHNMLVSTDFRLKVTDFGIARALATSDVYSLGVILYEMLTGQLPFKASDSTELARMHRDEIPIPPRRLNPAIPESLEEITLKVLSKEPAARYRTADQLGRVLLSFVNINKDKTGPIILPQAGSANHKPEKEKKESAPLPFVLPEQPDPKDEEPSDSVKEEDRVDWLTWGLGLLAFTTVLGLIPFWLFIYFSINP